MASAVKALEVLGPPSLRSLAEKMPTVDPLDGSFRSVWIGVRFRAHALDVRRLAERIGHEIGYADRDELVASALLRDLGKLAHLATMGNNNPVSYDGKALDDRHPLLATDHAVYGALLARRWKLPERLVQAIEAQQDHDADGEAAIVLLADRLTRFGQGHHSDLRSIVALSERVGVNRSLLTQLLYELPDPLPAPPGPTANVPLSDREIDVLKLLAQGKLYKEIASDLGLAPSTVRSHLHRIYHRMGARDRTQAVLGAIDRNWI